MRVALLTNTSCRVNAAVREALLRSEAVELEHVFLYDTLAEFKRNPLRSVKQFGVLPILRKAVQMLASRSISRANRGSVPANQWCQQNEIAHSVVADINNAASLEQLQAINVDVLVVCVCKNILKSPALGASKLGAINIHPSLLPKYRGPCPTFWARYHQDERIGVTVHRMTRKIDCGSILGQYSTDANYDLSDDQIESELFGLAADHLPSVLARLAEGDTSHETPLEPGAPYFPFPTAAQRRELGQRIS